MRQKELFTSLRRRERAQVDDSRRHAAHLATLVEAAEARCRELLALLQRLRALAPPESADPATSPLHSSALPPSSPVPDASGEPHSPSHEAARDQQQQKLPLQPPLLRSSQRSPPTGPRAGSQPLGGLPHHHRRPLASSASSQPSVPGAAATWPPVAPPTQAPPVSTMPQPASLPPQTAVPVAQVPPPAATAQPLTAPQAPQTDVPSPAPPTGALAPTLAPATPALPLVPPLSPASPGAPPSPVIASPQQPHSLVAQPVAPASPTLQNLQPPSRVPPPLQLAAYPASRRAAVPCGSPALRLGPGFARFAAPRTPQVRPCLPNNPPQAFPQSRPRQPLRRPTRVSRRRSLHSPLRSSPADPLAASLQTSSSRTRRRHSDSDAGPPSKRSRRDSPSPSADSSHALEGRWSHSSSPSAPQQPILSICWPFYLGGGGRCRGTPLLSDPGSAPGARQRARFGDTARPSLCRNGATRQETSHTHGGMERASLSDRCSMLRNVVIHTSLSDECDEL
ncbi:hypothetical protein Efla_003366 [Eimeria flavescens]